MSQSAIVHRQIQRWIYYVLGVLETILAMRLLLRLLGANPGSAFVAFIYSLSQAFIAPFSGIFRSVVSPGIETASVFEPATLVAMIVYGLIAYALARISEIWRKGRLS